MTNSGLGLPGYMKWKSRSGCYFCFYQSKLEWVGLYENHPDLYKKAMSYEYKNCDKIKKGHFGWRSDTTLEDLIKPENIKNIKEKYTKLKEKRDKQKSQIKTKLINMYGEDDDNFFLEDEYKESNACVLCHL